jgi:uncharacterized cupredoxin-like copper-binding protein
MRLVAPAAFLLVACGGQQKTSGESSVAVVLNAGSLKATPAAVRSGPIAFQILNAGTEIHEVVLLKTDRRAATLPMAASGEQAAESAGEKVDEVEDIAPGATAALRATLEAGHYVLLCNVPGHYMAHMYLDFDVTP